MLNDLKVLLHPPDNSRVAVVLHGDEPGPGPDVSLEHSLVRALLPPGGPGQLVSQDLGPGPGPLVTHIGLLRVQPRPPGGPQQRGVVGGVVPHGVDGQARPQPLPHRRHLPLTGPAVQVPAQVDVHLGVQGREKPPVQREDICGIIYWCPW